MTYFKRLFPNFRNNLAGLVDVDGDGLLDVATVSAYDVNSASVYRGKGDGTFASPITTTTGVSANADMNGDGLADALQYTVATNTVSYYLGQPGGGWLPQKQTLLVKPVRTQGDINADGSLDEVLRPDQLSLKVLFGNGDETFATYLASQTLTAYATLGPYYTLYDFNGDGRLDIFFAGLTGTGLGGYYDMFLYVDPRRGKSADFNGDGCADLLLRQSNATVVWTMQGATVAGQMSLPQPAANWHAVAFADFDRDGASDILWWYDNEANLSDTQNGIAYISFPNGSVNYTGALVQQATPDWRIAGTGDFDGDGGTDVLYRRGSGATYIVAMTDAPARTTAASDLASLQVYEPNWSIAGVGDFNGDGRDDILWRYENSANAVDAMNGMLYAWLMNGTHVAAAAPLSQQPGSAQWTVAAVADFDGDGKADILLRHAQQGAADPLQSATYIDFMDGLNVAGAPTSFQIDSGSAITTVADYTGDGRSDIVWREAATGALSCWEMDGASVLANTPLSQQPGAGWTVQAGSFLAPY